MSVLTKNTTYSSYILTIDDNNQYFPTQTASTIILNPNNESDLIYDRYIEPRRKETKRRLRCECCDALLPLEEIKHGIVKCEFCGAVQDSEDIIKD